MINKVSGTIISPAAAPSVSQKSKTDATGSSFSSVLAGAGSDQAAKKTESGPPSLLAAFAAAGAKQTLKQNVPAAAATAKAEGTAATATKPAETTKAAETTAVTNTAADVGGYIDFSPQAHENRMNSWLIGEMTRENQRKMDVYNQDMQDWAINERQRQYLGLPSQPPPAAPQLAKVEAKPAGFWFTSGISA